MKKLGAFGLWAVLLFVQCTRSVPEPPSHLIQPEAMVPLLVDVHLVEGARNGALMLGDSNDIEDYYARLYTKHGISEELFIESFSWYNGEPDAFIPIYERVLDSLKVNGALIAKRGVEVDYDH